MSLSSKVKKKIFDIAKKNKRFRVAARAGRDAAYHAKMVMDEPFGRIDDKLVYFQTFSGRGYSDSPKAMYEYMLLPTLGCCVSVSSDICITYTDSPFGTFPLPAVKVA